MLPICLSVLTDRQIEQPDRDIQTEHKDKCTDRQAVEWTDRHTDRQTNELTDKQMY